MKELRYIYGGVWTRYIYHSDGKTEQHTVTCNCLLSRLFDAIEVKTKYPKDIDIKWDEDEVGISSVEICNYRLGKRYVFKAVRSMAVPFEWEV